MKIFILITLLLCSTFCSFSQLDYRVMKDTICPRLTYCGFRDSADLAIIYPKLQSLDTTTLSKGLAEYYEDLGDTEYQLYAYSNDFDLLQRSINNNIKALYHSPNNPNYIWDIAFGYNWLGECNNATKYLSLYADHCPKKYWDKEQIGYQLERCPNEELSKRFKIKKKEN